MTKIVILMLVIIFAAYGNAQDLMSDCPSACVCKNIFCRRKNDKETKCSGVAVDCHGRNLTAIPEHIPLSVTGLRLSNNNIHRVDLDDFRNFTNLKNLMLDNNNATLLVVNNVVRGLKRLSLSGNHLTSLPSDGLINLKTLVDLNLQQNQIQDIQYIRFPRRLEMLNLNNNRIQHLTSGTFTKLKQLRVLKLNNNSISFMKPKAFKFLKQLEEVLQSIEMEHNRLRKLPKDAFTSLSYGWYLNLKNNRINDIHPLSFRLFGYKNQNHHQIHLENNQLHFVEREDVGLLISRQDRYSLYFAGNPIFCDCNLIELHKEAKLLFGDSERMVCDSPRNFTGTSVQALHIADCCY